ncbi:unnamed protein product, partial [Rotaria magnacalcarata]
ESFVGDGSGWVLRCCLGFIPSRLVSVSIVFLGEFFVLVERAEIGVTPIKFL